MEKIIKIIWIVRDNILGSLDVPIPSCKNYIVVENSTKGIAKKLKREPAPALILLVIQKNDETALKALKKIRKQHFRTPVIVINFTHSMRCAEACANLSTQGYFVAPLDPSRLCEKIRKTLLKRVSKKNEDVAPHDSEYQGPPGS